MAPVEEVDPLEATPGLVDVAVASVEVVEGVSLDVAVTSVDVVEGVSLDVAVASVDVVEVGPGDPYFRGP